MAKVIIDESACVGCGLCERICIYSAVTPQEDGFTVDADLVLLAMGFVGPGRNILVEELKLERDLNSLRIIEIPRIAESCTIDLILDVVARLVVEHIKKVGS